MGAGSPSGAEQGRLGLSGVGEGLGMHWESKKNSKTRLGARIRSSGAAWGQFGASGA